MAKAKSSKSTLVREGLKAHPEKPAAEIAKEFGVSDALVYKIKRAEKTKNGKVPSKKRHRKSVAKAAAKVVTPKAAHDALDQAFEFVMKVGGLVHAEQLIGKLKALKEIYSLLYPAILLGLPGSSMVLAGRFRCRTERTKPTDREMKTLVQGRAQTIRNRWSTPLVADEVARRSPRDRRPHEPQPRCQRS